jgi:hypothetical protein
MEVRKPEFIIKLEYTLCKIITQDRIIFIYSDYNIERILYGKTITA